MKTQHIIQAAKTKLLGLNKLKAAIDNLENEDVPEKLSTIKSKNDNITTQINELTAYVDKVSQIEEDSSLVRIDEKLVNKVKPAFDRNKTMSTFKRHIAIGISYRIADFIEDSGFYILDFDIKLSNGVNLQRDFVWTLQQKQELIYSILKEQHIGNISAVQYAIREDGSRRSTLFKIVDGKQRLSTVLSFFNNEFPIIQNGQAYFFSELDNDTFLFLKRQNVLVNIVYEYHDDLLSDEEYIAWFKNINYAGTAQDKAHIDNLEQIRRKSIL